MTLLQVLELLFATTCSGYRALSGAEAYCRVARFDMKVAVDESSESYLAYPETWTTTRGRLRTAPCLAAALGS